MIPRYRFAGLAAMLGVASAAPDDGDEPSDYAFDLFAFDERPVYYDPDATPSMARRTERRRRIRARAAATKRRRGWR
mgnify:CR=1 FL=1